MPDGELFTSAFLEKLQHWIEVHHSVYRHLPPQGIYFESLVERAFLLTGWPRDQVVLTHPNSPRADTTVGTTRFSLKTETGNITRRNLISITKLRTTETGEWASEALIGHALSHLSRYEGILMLRTLWERENVIDYQLLAPDPLSLLSRRPKISKWDIFHYVYGLLHHPGYRAKFADNLKRELPRIPFAPDFRAFASAGAELARLHLDYEKLEPYPLKWLETPDVPLSYRVEDKMRLSKDKTAVTANPSLTLAGIPPETFAYRLGNRSALDWVIDQYQVSEDKRSGIRSDPNRADDPEYIVRLAGQVVRVSLETVRLVAGLPAQFSP